jgi:hypothetical protein
MCASRCKWEDYTDRHTATRERQSPPLNPSPSSSLLGRGEVREESSIMKEKKGEERGRLFVED